MGIKLHGNKLSEKRDYSISDIKAEDPRPPTHYQDTGDRRHNGIGDNSENEHTEAYQKKYNKSALMIRE